MTAKQRYLRGLERGTMSRIVPTIELPTKQVSTKQVSTKQVSTKQVSTCVHSWEFDGQGTGKYDNYSCAKCPEHKTVRWIAY
jgi:hypothetical protein